MKQRITTMQVTELSLDQQKRLLDWWKPQDGDCYISDNGTHYMFTNPMIDKTHLLPLLSIGQMIEILKYFQGSCIEISNSPVGFYPWTITNFNVGNDLGTAGDKELCDALFAAVKQVI